MEILGAVKGALNEHDDIYDIAWKYNRELFKQFSDEFNSQVHEIINQFNKVITREIRSLHGCHNCSFENGDYCDHPEYGGRKDNSNRHKCYFEDGKHLDIPKGWVKK